METVNPGREGAPPAMMKCLDWSDDEAPFPPGKRLAPVGANDDDDIPDEDRVMETGETELQKRLRQMEDDQEELTNSLMSMTSHFAKVQLRLQQVVSAPSERRESLLKELESFAFRGIPNLSSPRPLEEPEDNNNAKVEEEKDVDNEILEAQRKKQSELINHLRSQLEELESYAYASGEGIVPSNLLLERQRVVMEQLKSRLNLNLDRIDKLTEDELKAEVDSAVGQIVHPLKMKSHLVNQLKTQITDLEMFIEFLQGEASTMVPSECVGCGCSKHNSPAKSSHPVSKFRSRSKSEQDAIREHTATLLEKAVSVLQLVTVSQFGCGAENSFYKNTLKQTPKGNHYGDLRARLELAVDHLLEVCCHVECRTDTDSSDAGSSLDFLMASPQVTSIVRKELAVAIRDLMQHGILESSGSGSSLVPFMGCMSSRRRPPTSSMTHAWDVVLKFYEMKGGREFNSQPARRLSQSFGLDLTGSTANSKQTLLTTIGQIIASHRPYKRTPDAQFKAFVCAGLNKRKLIPWLKLILRNQTILESFYQPWSYVVKTGFDDSLRAIDRLSIYVFDLPVNVAIRQFEDMNDAF